MKNKFTKQKWSTILQVLLYCALTAVIVYGVLVFLTTGSTGESAQKVFLKVLTLKGMSSEAATSLYNNLFVYGKLTFVFGWLFFLMLIFFLMVVSQMASRLSDIYDALEEVLTDEAEPEELSKDLSPIAEQVQELRKEIRQLKQTNQQLARQKPLYQKLFDRQPAAGTQTAARQPSGKPLQLSALFRQIRERNIEAQQK